MIEFLISFACIYMPIGAIIGLFMADTLSNYEEVSIKEYIILIIIASFAWAIYVAKALVILSVLRKQLYILTKERIK